MDYILTYKDKSFTQKDPKFDDLKIEISTNFGLDTESYAISYSNLNGENVTIWDKSDFVDCGLEFSYTPDIPVQLKVEKITPESEGFVLIDDISYSGILQSGGDKSLTLSITDKNSQNSSQRSLIIENIDISKLLVEEEPYAESEDDVTADYLHCEHWSTDCEDDDVDELFDNLQFVPESISRGAQRNIEVKEALKRIENERNEANSSHAIKKMRLIEDLYENNIMSEEEFFGLKHKNKTPENYENNIMSEEEFFGLKPKNKTPQNAKDDEYLTMYSCHSNENSDVSPMMKNSEEFEFNLTEKLQPCDEKKSLIEGGVNIEVPFLSKTQSEDLGQKDLEKVHNFVQCDACKCYPIIGTRYKCLQCFDYDLCSKCEESNHKYHIMVRIPNNHVKITDFKLLHQNLDFN